MIMVTSPSFGSPSFRSAAKGLIALHQLIKDGKDDSPEAESVRDALDLPLRALNRIEKERAQWLSEDLYSVSEPSTSTTQKEMNPQAQQQLNEAYEARQGREWDRALALLRRWKDYISPALLSYLRGAIWLEAGNLDVAAVFYGHASECDRANSNYQAMYLHALAESDPDLARKLADEILADDTNHGPGVVAQAANILLNKTRIVSGTEASQLYHRLIAILGRNAERIDKDEESASRSPIYGMTVGLLGFCHEFLGNAGTAVDCYSRGLRVNPNNDGLLTARGILQYGSGPRAIHDFEQAIALGSPLIWPYLFLAHYYLTTRQFERCREMCEAGLRKRGSDMARGQLEEWRAIAQAELGFPPDLVRAAFEEVFRLDPSNDMARRNQAAYEASLKTRHTPPHLNWAQKSEAAVRRFGLAERRASLVAA
jgi:tetratricopeptide (TPR) repeat protein